MKIEIGRQFPSHFRPAYPEEFALFSHLEVASAVPSALFAITTWKENGLPNVCLHAWSCFHGDRTAFFAVLGGLYQKTHTYANILRDRCFCLNFLSLRYYDRLVETIRQNGEETDEFAAGGFTRTRAKTVNAPCIEEAFLTMECTLEDARDLSGAGVMAMITGRVERVAVEEGYAQGYARYGEDGFMLLVPAPQDLKTGAPAQSAIAIPRIRKLD